MHCYMESYCYVVLPSSFLTTALDFEKEMSRRSLRLHTITGLYGDDSLDSNLNHNVYHGASFSHNSSVTASDASMLDESCIQERTLVGSFWGLDEASEDKGLFKKKFNDLIDHNYLSCLRHQCLEWIPFKKANFVFHYQICLCVTERTMTVDHSMCGTNGDINSVQTQTSMVNGSFCKDFPVPSDRHEALSTYSSSSTGACSATSYQALTAPSTSPPSTVYEISVAQLNAYNRRSTSSAPGNSCCCWEGNCLAQGKNGRFFNLAGSGIRTIDLSVTGQELLTARLPAFLACLSLSKHFYFHVFCLCCSPTLLMLIGDDCKRKQHTETHATYTTWASWSHHVLGALWLAAVYTGYLLIHVLWVGQEAGSAVWAVMRRMLSVPWLAVRSPGKAATGVFWWLGTGWYHLVTLLSLLNVFVLTRLLSVLPVVNVTEWRTAYPLSLILCIADLSPSPVCEQPGSVAVSVDSERLAQLEQRLAHLWEKVEGGGQRQEQQHGEVLGLYHSLREQLDTQTDRDGMGLWVSGLLEEKLALLRREMEKDAALQREQVILQGQESRLAQLEVLLQTLAAKTEVHIHRSYTTFYVYESHDALLAEVQRLEAALGSIRQDLQEVMGCQGMGDRLDKLHDMVSCFELAGDSEPGEKELPESLLQWLSERYVSGADLQASLASLELSILQNVSLQLEESRARQEMLSTETVSQTVMHTVGAGMSEEHVQLMVKNALKLYSQDRTGLVDYALESGGGNILGTRCSETYETKTALMSLFGLPLWYFSQSPRVVIQPDVHPGNCWAFQGSHGYLVVRLSMRIVPSAFSLEHIPKDMSPTGNIDSAPRQFNVYGLDDEYQEEGKLLGSYTYQEDGDALQTYPVTEENDKAYQTIEVRVLSNWGHTEYTCLYRIRVHGQPSID
uniref:SUN domain-containing protein n=1 Tax=Salmo trutta TaxID=8032 RepID=A0A674BM40_SALTR